MKHCILIHQSASIERIPDATILHWEAWDVPVGHFSLPSCLSQHLTKIRQEHAHWAWELGRTEIHARRVCDHFTLSDGSSMWWYSLLYERHPKMTPSLYTVFKLRALEIFLDREGIERLTLLGGDSLLARTLSDFCQKSGRSFFWKKGTKVSARRDQSLVRLLYTHTPASVRTLVRAVHWWWTVKRHLPEVHLERSTGSLATIATYFPNIDSKKADLGRFCSRYWMSLHELLNKRAAEEGGQFVRWLFIRFPSPEVHLSKCIALRNRFQKEQLDGEAFIYLEECIGTDDCMPVLRDYFRLRAKSKALEKDILQHFHFEGSNLNFSHYLRADYIESFRGWRCLERCLMARAFKNYVQETGRTRFTLFPLENCPWERMLTYAVQKMGGKVIGAQHSSIRPTDLRYFDDPAVFQNQEDLPVPHRILGNGQSAFRQWREVGVPQEKLGVIEALRYLYLAESTKEEADAWQDIRKDTNERTLLVLTSFFRDETEAHLRLFLMAFRAGLFRDLPIVIKAHPCLGVEEWLPQDVRKHLVIGTAPLPQYFTGNVLVWASNSTTAALEAAMRGLAVAVMRPTSDFDLSPIQDIPDLIRTASLGDVEKMLTTAKPCQIPPDYLLLDPDLSRWHKELDL